MTYVLTFREGRKETSVHDKQAGIKCRRRPRMHSSFHSGVSGFVVSPFAKMHQLSRRYVARCRLHTALDAGYSRGEENYFGTPQLRRCTVICTRPLSSTSLQIQLISEGPTYVVVGTTLNVAGRLRRLCVYVHILPLLRCI